MALAASLTRYAANAPVIVSRIGTDIALLIDPMSDERYFYVWMAPCWRSAYGSRWMRSPAKGRNRAGRPETSKWIGNRSLDQGDEALFAFTGKRGQPSSSSSGTSR